MIAVAFVVVAAAATVVRAIATAGPTPGRLPTRTLVVNTLGAGLLGIFTTAQFPHVSLVWSVAALGSLTTFSTVAGETAALLDDGHKRTAMLYVGLTLIAGIAAAWIGLELGEAL